MVERKTGLAVLDDAVVGLNCLGQVAGGYRTPAQSAAFEWIVDDEGAIVPN